MATRKEIPVLTEVCNTEAGGTYVSHKLGLVIELAKQYEQDMCKTSITKNILR